MATVRIAGVNLPARKRIEAALPYIYGIGFSRARKILNTVKIDPNKRTADLSENEVEKLKEFIEGNFKVEGSLRQEILQNIKRLKEIAAYRGIRHIRGLPVRGQRTRTNTRTVRGNVRRTAGSGRRAAAEKT
ncbi:MAG: 30S ribosomal protein S13 [Candidatus Doudnabacteria bacterium]|nr:30S ribosomal protein S13 [bacterium]MDZ4244002.1 30S ribosomal protein S13 [Candidatus Doudnabacteria bacterium]